ncbi:hypothetical protein CANARDRAFT_187145, partial [[Candida] arabinofermentans NRRL YB-2248]
YYLEQPLYKKILLAVVAVIFFSIDVLVIFNYDYVITKMAELSTKWNSYGFRGVVIVFLLVFFVSFPPMIGFSYLCVLTGMTYGFAGWPILTIASVSGSTCSFILFKYVLSDISLRMMESSAKLKLFVSVLNDQRASFKQNLLVMSFIRMSPLPYSFSNGALAAVPGLSVSVFSSASILTSPKYVIPLFIGSQMKKIGEETSGVSRIVDAISVLVAAGSTATVTYIIYGRLKAKIQ